MKKDIIWKCKYCDYVGKTRRDLQKHNREVHGIGPRGKGQIAWNKGLNKETSDKIKEISKHVSESLTGKPGHKHTDETKEKISKIRKQYIKLDDGLWILHGLMI